LKRRARNVFHIVFHRIHGEFICPQVISNCDPGHYAACGQPKRMALSVSLLGCHARSGSGGDTRSRPEREIK
jgi:hypothetical protein